MAFCMKGVVINIRKGREDQSQHLKRKGGSASLKCSSHPYVGRLVKNTRGKDYVSISCGKKWRTHDEWGEGGVQL